MGLTLNRRHSADGSYAGDSAWEPLVSSALPGTDLLTEGQRRHLIASLECVEQALAEIAALSNAQPSDDSALLSKPQRDLPPDFPMRIHGPLADAAATLGELANTFQLMRSPSSSLRSVQALVTTSLVVVEDTASRQLHGYGAVHPDLPRLLDPLLARLHEQLRRIGRAL